jgi:hypothetical protein
LPRPRPNKVKVKALGFAKRSAEVVERNLPRR